MISFFYMFFLLKINLAEKEGFSDVFSSPIYASLRNPCLNPSYIHYK